MAGWDPVPWMVGGGAQHSPEVARMLAYVAFRGNEGIIAAGDLKVNALGVPGGSVTVDPGACSILCRATGQLHQAYAGRVATQDTVDIAPTTADSGRSDLVIARVEDPWLAGEPWADPSDPTVGPYIYTRVIPNVPNTTKTLRELGLGYSGIELARVDIPVSTGAITQAMIVDLRRVANPRRERYVFTANQAAAQALSSAAFVSWPSSGSWQVDIPVWATKAIIRGSAGGVSVPALGATAGQVYGQIRVTLGTLATQGTGYDETVPGGANYDRKYWAVADTLTIPSGTRGTRQTIRLEGVRFGGNVNASADTGTSCTVDVEFVEAAA